jgi:hypothetical protein
VRRRLAHRREQARLGCHQVRQLAAEILNRGLHRRVDHIADSGRAAAHPLAAAAEFGHIELSRGAAALGHGVEHRLHGIGANLVLLRELRDDLFTIGR